MIDHLGLRNFKRFAEAGIELRDLTVLTGLNGAGKSTVIQSLLLARQVVERPDTTVVELNGPHGLELGEAEDVLHPDAERSDTIDLAVGAQGERYEYRFAVPKERALHLTVKARPASPPVRLAGRGAAFTYLTAERLGPRDQLAVTARSLDDVGVGEQGQYAGQVLALHERDVVAEAMLHPDTGSDGVTTLRGQVERWCAEIVRPIRITAEWPPGLNASVVRFTEPNSAGTRIRPMNIGFGVSYALPIIVAGLLAAGTDAMLVVENPEAHLHPAGQSKIGRFLGRLAGSGAQVLVETHSDHLLNGIRLAAVENQVVEPDRVLVHFFGAGEAGSTDLTSIELTDRGGLTSWPTGFFDQLERDLEGLARAKRRSRNGDH